MNCEVYMIAVCWCVELKNDEALYLFFFFAISLIFTEFVKEYLESTEGSQKSK